MVNQVELFETTDPDDVKIPPKDKRQIYYDRSAEIAESIIQQMRNGDSNWTMPWHSGIPLAKNVKTGRQYTGQNMLLLWQKCKENNYAQNIWGTFNQWNRRGARVKRGEKGTLICIVYPKNTNENASTTEGTQLELDINNDQKYKKYLYNYNFKFIHVFNANQVSDYDPNQPDLFQERQNHDDHISTYIQCLKADIRHGGDRAYYHIVGDYIQMPEKARFIGTRDYSNTEMYNSTLLHEIMHWTGHSSRCNRKFGKKFGDRVYAFEELVAELGCAILSTEFHNRVFPRQDHSKYLNNWLSVLEHDFSFMYAALDLARYAINYSFYETGFYPVPVGGYSNKQISEEQLNRWFGA